PLRGHRRAGAAALSASRAKRKGHSAWRGMDGSDGSDRSDALPFAPCAMRHALCAMRFALCRLTHTYIRDILALTLTRRSDFDHATRQIGTAADRGAGAGIATALSAVAGRLDQPGSAGQYARGTMGADGCSGCAS